MSIVRIAGLAVVAAFGISALAVGDADAAKKKPGKCVLAGGQGEGWGEPLARDIARDALTETLANGGMKGVGKVSYKCDGGAPISTCVAKQKACK